MTNRFYPHGPLPPESAPAAHKWQQSAQVYYAAYLEQYHQREVAEKLRDIMEASRNNTRENFDRLAESCASMRRMLWLGMASGFLAGITAGIIL